jgi:hypothetical protein
MDTSSELLEVAAELEDRARAIATNGRGLTGHLVARATGELVRSTVYCVIALRRLSESGIAAWEAIDSRFPPDPADPPRDPSKATDPFADRKAELDVISCLLSGDMVLDDLAYAELVRRNLTPEWEAGQERMPSMWPRLMRVLDAEPADPMTGPARYLDVTLVHARDVLVAHRDPTIHYLPSYSNSGQVTLTRANIDPVRDTAAAERVSALAAELEYRPYGLDTRTLLDHLVALSPRLGREQRETIKTAYRYSGFESPHLTEMMTRVSRLLRHHNEGLERLLAERSSGGESPGKP